MNLSSSSLVFLYNTSYMKKHYRWVFFAGLIVLLLPFVGIPYSWKMILEFFIGFVLIALALIEKQMFVYTEFSNSSNSSLGSKDTVEEDSFNNSAQDSMFENYTKDEEIKEN